MKNRKKEKDVLLDFIYWCYDMGFPMPNSKCAFNWDTPAYNEYRDEDIKEFRCMIEEYINRDE